MYKYSGISYDPVKRARTLQERGLDFEDAVQIFEGLTLDAEDRRFDYGEVRMITAGFLKDRLMIVVWTARGDKRHIISMRKANDREQALFKQRLDQEG